MTSHTAATRTQRWTTRVLLICAALAAVQTVISLAISPATPMIAATAPPLYALIATVHSVVPFLARIVTGVRWSATLTAGIAGALIWPFSAIGALVMLVLLVAGASFDVTLLNAGHAPRRRRLIIAAGATATVLFLAALPAFSPQHLTPLVLVSTLVCRIIGELIAVVAAIALAAALSRAGVAHSRFT